MAERLARSDNMMAWKVYCMHNEECRIHTGQTMGELDVAA